MATMKIGLVDDSNKIFKHAMVDRDVYERLNKFKWTLDRDGRPYRTTSNKEGRTCRVPMPRAVFDLDAGDKRKVFYQNTGQLLDCRKANLNLTVKSPGNIAKVMPNGTTWPSTAKSFENYTRNYLRDVTVEDFFQQFKASKDDLMELVEMADDVKWSFRRITFRYQEDSPVLKKAQTLPTSTLVQRFLKDQFEWVCGVASSISIGCEPYRTQAQKAEEDRKATEEKRIAEEAIQAEKDEKQALSDRNQKLIDTEVEKRLANTHIPNPEFDVPDSLEERDLTVKELMAVDLDVLIKAIKMRGATEVRF